VICERCFQSLDAGEHGQNKCPYEPRPASVGVIADEIPGGLEVRHGICNEDGTPRRYYSKSEMAREAKARGLVNYVRHVGSKGSDKSKTTSRWV
jgi:hypothetical protein